MNGETGRKGEAPLTIDHYNPVDVAMRETIGTTLLGVVALILLIALLRSQARNRKLLGQLAGDGEGVGARNLSGQSIGGDVGRTG
ncbi:MAG: hypothetical protein R3248_04835 [Candidatus Promineifilaceae bacterium]|nr:hypothetical protein [Candidatus Promineifilaceae bacterium]